MTISSIDEEGWSGDAEKGAERHLIVVEVLFHLDEFVEMFVGLAYAQPFDGVEDFWNGLGTITEDSVIIRTHWSIVVSGFIVDR